MSKTLTKILQKQWSYFKVLVIQVFQQLRILPRAAGGGGAVPSLLAMQVRRGREGRDGEGERACCVQGGESSGRE